MNTNDVLEINEECGTENALFIEMYKQKQRLYSRFFNLDLKKNFFFCRQKDMQRKLDKITDLVRLVVQKMEIRTEMEGDDTYRSGKNENFMKMQKVRQTLNVAHRFARLRSSNKSIPTLFDHSEKV